jgi:hypothetical protein
MFGQVDEDFILNASLNQTLKEALGRNGRDRNQILSWRTFGCSAAILIP